MLNREGGILPNISVYSEQNRRFPYELSTTSIGVPDFSKSDKSITFWVPIFGHIWERSSRKRVPACCVRLQELNSEDDAYSDIQ